MNSLDIPVRRVCLLLWAVVLLTIGLGVGWELYRLALPQSGQPGAGGPLGMLLKQFDLEAEGNVQTWVSSTLLVGAALVAALTAGLARLRRDGGALQWSFIALVFVFLSLDEAAQLHEKTNLMLGRVAGAPAGIDLMSLALVAVVGAALLRFVLQLDAPTRNGLVRAGIVFVTGAAGIEVVTNKLLHLNHAGLLSTLVVTPFEECLEMSGVAIFVRTLLLRLAADARPIELRFLAAAGVASDAVREPQVDALARGPRRASPR